ncbi:cubilin [Trichonephila clavata]|uniref:Cubilin n=1 Tax=Trichonephila clavata TaxID=2740835 RepID=A0A8X6LQ16_TRICU|nr:cubilin [Trichonephila clavata]
MDLLSETAPCGPSSLFAEAEPKSVTTPSYPLQYPINMRCKWVVYRNSTESRSLSMVQITIKDLGINCSGDYVEVQKMRYGINQRRYYGSDFKGPVRLCGNVPVHDIFAVNSMSIYFHSDSINNSGRGFFFTYQEASCNRTYTESTAVLTNLAYPGRFNAVKDCAKNITIAQGKTISLYFSRLELYDPTQGCVNSYMKVYDGTNTSAPLLGTFCGFNEPDPVYSSGNSLHVVTRMHHSSGSYYFIYVTADKDQGCGGNVYAEEGHIYSPRYPQAYTSTDECVWHISVPGYHTIKVEFEGFAFNSSSGCESNFVELYDGTVGNVEERVVRYCGTDTPGTHLSTTNKMIIKMQTDSNNSGVGFKLRFTSNSYMPESSMRLIQKDTLSVSDYQYDTAYIYLN